MSVFKPFAFKTKHFGIVTSVTEDKLIIAGKENTLELAKETATYEEGQTIYLKLKDNAWVFAGLEPKPAKTTKGNPDFTADELKRFKQLN